MSHLLDFASEYSATINFPNELNPSWALREYIKDQELDHGECVGVDIVYGRVNHGPAFLPDCHTDESASEVVAGSVAFPGCHHLAPLPTAESLVPAQPESPAHNVGICPTLIYPSSPDLSLESVFERFFSRSVSRPRSSVKGSSNTERKPPARGPPKPKVRLSTSILIASSSRSVRRVSAPQNSPSSPLPPSAACSSSSMQLLAPHAKALPAGRAASGNAQSRRSEVVPARRRRSVARDSKELTTDSIVHHATRTLSPASLSTLPKTPYSTLQLPSPPALDEVVVSDDSPHASKATKRTHDVAFSEADEDASSKDGEGPSKKQKGDDEDQRLPQPIDLTDPNAVVVCPIGNCTSTYRADKAQAQQHIREAHADLARNSHSARTFTLAIRCPCRPMMLKGKLVVCNQMTQVLNLGRHIVTTHAPEKPAFGCPNCSATFTRRDPAKRHIRRVCFSESGPSKKDKSVGTGRNEGESNGNGKGNNQGKSNGKSKPKAKSKPKGKGCSRTGGNRAKFELYDEEDDIGDGDDSNASDEDYVDGAE